MKESAARTRILDVASRLFYEQGYNSTGINQIIDEADIARGSLYNHFPSKHDLLSAYLQQAEDIWFAELDNFLEPMKDHKKKLLGLFDFRMQRQLQSNFGGCLFIKAGAEIARDDLKAFEHVQHQKDRLKQYVSDLVQQADIAQPKGFNKAMLADTIFLLLEGATVTDSLYKNAEMINKAKKIAKALLSN